MDKNFRHDLGHLLVRYMKTNSDVEKLVKETLEFLWNMPDDFDSPSDKFKYFVSIFADLYFDDFRKHFKEN